MFFAWQVTNDPKYQAPFTRAVEATYANSELHGYADAVQDKAKHESPIVATTLPIVYVVTTQKQMFFKSKKITLVPGSMTSYNYNQTMKTGSVAVTFTF